MKVQLVKREAPAYWTRWAVQVDGFVVGGVEKRSGGWYAFGADGRYLRGLLPSRRAAVDFVVQEASK